jgi:hypothetical protein
MWNNLSVVERMSRSRNEWITLQLVKHFQEDAALAYQGALDGLPVSQELGSQYSEFERCYLKQDKYKKAAQQTYFETTQPEAAEFLRKQAAEKLVKGAGERANNAEATVKENGEAAFHWTEETRYQKMKEESIVILAKGKTPLVWDWEKDSAGQKADCNGIDIDLPSNQEKRAGEAIELKAVNKELLAYAAEKRMRKAW